MGPLDAGDRRDKAVAMRGNGLNAPPLRPPLIENPAKRRDLNGQIGIVDRRTRPNGPHDLVLRDESTRPLDQHLKDIKRPHTDRYRNENAVFVLTKKPAVAAIEPESLEQENVGRDGHVQASRASARASPNQSACGPPQFRAGILEHLGQLGKPFAAFLANFWRIFCAALQTSCAAKTTLANARVGLGRRHVSDMRKRAGFEPSRSLSLVGIRAPRRTGK